MTFMIRNDDGTLDTPPEVFELQRSGKISNKNSFLVVVDDWKGSITDKALSPATYWGRIFRLGPCLEATTNTLIDCKFHNHHCRNKNPLKEADFPLERILGAINESVSIGFVQSNRLESFESDISRRKFAEFLKILGEREATQYWSKDNRYANAFLDYCFRVIVFIRDNLTMHCNDFSVNIAIARCDWLKKRSVSLMDKQGSIVMPFGDLPKFNVLSCSVGMVDQKKYRDQRISALLGLVDFEAWCMGRLLGQNVPGMPENETFDMYLAKQARNCWPDSDAIRIEMINSILSSREEKLRFVLNNILHSVKIGRTFFNYSPNNSLQVSQVVLQQIANLP